MILLPLVWLLLVASGIVSLVCLILVLVKMFQNNEVTMGVVCIVLTVLCGIGPLVTFVYGWIKSAEWNIQKIMLIWTACFIVNLLLGAVILFVGLAAAPDIIEMQQEMLRGFPQQ